MNGGRLRLRQAHPFGEQAIQGHGAGGQGAIVQRQHILKLFDTDGLFLKIDIRPVQHVLAEKPVHGFAVLLVVIVGRVQMQRLHIGRLIVQFVNGANRGKLLAGRVPGPVAGGLNNEHGSRGHHGADLHVRRIHAQVGRIFAHRATLHDRRNHVGWR